MPTRVTTHVLPRYSLEDRRIRRGFRGRSGWRRSALLLLPLLLMGCSAGDPRFTAEAPAGFWLGLWHGAISWVALVIGVFSDQVGVYERHNTGGLYDFGFLLGVLVIYGGGSHAAGRQTSRVSSSDKEQWEEIARKVESKLRRRIQEWSSAEPDEDWKLIGKQAEDKLKRKLREWAEDDKDTGRDLPPVGDGPKS